MMSARRCLAGAVETPMTTFTVRQGKRYRATIRLGFLEQLAGNTTIAARLSEAGFADVRVWGAGPVRTAEALWPDADQSADLPAQISSVVELA
jgi:hypothetical protein